METKAPTFPAEMLAHAIMDIAQSHPGLRIYEGSITLVHGVNVQAAGDPEPKMLIMEKFDIEITTEGELVIKSTGQAELRISEAEEHEGGYC